MRWGRELQVKLVAGIIVNSLKLNTYGSGWLLVGRALDQAHQSSSTDELGHVVGTESLHYPATGFKNPLGTVQNRGCLGAVFSLKNAFKNLGFGSHQRAGGNAGA